MLLLVGDAGWLKVRWKDRHYLLHNLKSFNHPSSLLKRQHVERCKFLFICSTQTCINSSVLDAFKNVNIFLLPWRPGLHSVFKMWMDSQNMTKYLFARFTCGVDNNINIFFFYNRQQRMIIDIVPVMRICHAKVENVALIQVEEQLSICQPLV